MTSHARPVPSLRRPSAWLAVLGGLGAYGVLVWALARARLSLELPLPAWAALAGPPILYALLILLFRRGVRPGRLLAVTLVLWAAHLALGTATAALPALVHPAAGPGGAFPPPPLPAALWVPLLLVLLRDLAAPSTPIRRPVRVPVEPPRPAPSRVPAPERPAGPSHPALAGPRVSESPPPGEAAAAPEAGPAQEGPIPALLAAEETRVKPVWPEAPPARPVAIVEPAGAPVPDEAVRIPFARIAGQLPPEVFALPLDGVGAELAEPGQLQVPRALILPQLAEGLLRVEWGVVAPQVPDHCLAASREEIGRRVPDGLIELPLDEVIPQLPPEVFALRNPAPEVHGLESVPAPFRPWAGEAPAIEPETAVAGPPAAAVEAEVEPVEAPPPAAFEAEVTPVEVPAPPEVEPVSVIEAAPDAGPALAEELAQGAEPVRVPLLAEAPAPAAPERPAEPIRISFQRIAAQLPAEGFLLPLERISANLSEPGQLLVPRELVLPQLAEGAVGVDWEAVADQFPRHLLAVTDEEIKRHLPEGALALPLDEVIPQLPSDLFAVLGPAPDVAAIESVPAPFHPFLSWEPPPPVPEPVVLSATVDAPVEESLAAPETVEAAGAPVGRLEASTWEPVAGPETEPAREEAAPEGAGATLEPAAQETPASGENWREEPLPPEPAAEPVTEPERVTAAARDVEPLLAEPPLLDLEGDFEMPPLLPVVDAPRPPALEEPPLVEIQAVEPDPALLGLVEAEIAHAAEEPEPLGPAAAALSPEDLAEVRRLGTALAPFLPLDVDVQLVDGVRLFTLAPPGAEPEAARRAARLFVPPLGWSPWPVEQLTLRGPAGSLVLTAVGVPRSGGALLAAVVPRGGSLALVEILCRRAAPAGGVPEAGPAKPGNGRPAAELEPFDPDPRVHALAPSLAALGPVEASGLRAPGGAGRALYLFVAPGLPPAPVGGLAEALAGAMDLAAAAGVSWTSALLRAGGRTVLIRREPAGAGPAHVLAAAGETARPGLAYRQVERAARALGAS